MRKVTLKQIGYRIGGVARLKLWGGGEGSIEMQEIEIRRKITKDKLLSCINDNGHGCETIIKADIDIYDLFENQYEEYNRTIRANKRQCENGLKGI